MRPLDSPLRSSPPQPAAETYRDYVITVTPWRDDDGRWRCTGQISLFSDPHGEWTYETSSDHPDRLAACAAALAKGRRSIDRMCELAGR